MPHPRDRKFSWCTQIDESLSDQWSAHDPWPPALIWSHQARPISECHASSAPQAGYRTLVVARSEMSDEWGSDVMDHCGSGFCECICPCMGMAKANEIQEKMGWEDQCGCSCESALLSPV